MKLHVRVISAAAHRACCCTASPPTAPPGLPFVAPLALSFPVFTCPTCADSAAAVAHLCGMPVRSTTYAEDLEDLLPQLGLDCRCRWQASRWGRFTALQSFGLFGGRRYSRYMHIDQGLVIRNTRDLSPRPSGRAPVQTFGRMRAALDQIAA